jgi:hypothetical protein
MTNEQLFLQSLPLNPNTPAAMLASDSDKSPTEKG